MKKPTSVDRSARTVTPGPANALRSNRPDRWHEFPLSVLWVRSAAVLIVVVLFFVPGLLALRQEQPPELMSVVGLPGAAASVVLITLLTIQELLRAHGGAKERVAARTLNIASIPLLMLFAVVVVVRLAAFSGHSFTTNPTTVFLIPAAAVALSIIIPSGQSRHGTNQQSGDRTSQGRLECSAQHTSDSFLLDNAPLHVIPLCPFYEDSSQSQAICLAEPRCASVTSGWAAKYCTTVKHRECSVFKEVMTEQDAT